MAPVNSDVQRIISGGIAARLRSAMDEGDWSVARLAAATDVPESNLTRYRKTGRLPAHHAAALAGKLGISGHWLLFGAGPVQYVEPSEELAAYREACKQMAAILAELSLSPPRGGDIDPPVGSGPPVRAAREAIEHGTDKPGCAQGGT